MRSKIKGWGADGDLALGVADEVRSQGDKSRGIQHSARFSQPINKKVYQKNKPKTHGNPGELKTRSGCQ